MIDHDYRVGYQVLIRTRSAFKYKTQLQGPYGVFQTWKNCTITLRVGAVTYRTNTHRINPYNMKNTE